MFPDPLLQEGFDRDGKDREGYDIFGYKEGFDREGYDKEGYDKEGFNRCAGTVGAPAGACQCCTGGPGTDAQAWTTTGQLRG